MISLNLTALKSLFLICNGKELQGKKMINNVKLPIAFPTREEELEKMETDSLQIPKILSSVLFQRQEN